MDKTGRERKSKGVLSTGGFKVIVSITVTGLLHCDPVQSQVLLSAFKKAPLESGSVKPHSS